MHDKPIPPVCPHCADTLPVKAYWPVHVYDLDPNVCVELGQWDGCCARSVIDAISEDSSIPRREILVGRGTRI